MEQPLDTFQQPNPAENTATIVEQPAPPSPEAAVVTLQRVTFNYVVIAIAFLALGVMIGAGAYNRIVDSNEELIEKAVSAAVAAGGGGITQEQLNAAIAQALSDQQGVVNDPNRRYDVAVGDSPTRGFQGATVTFIEFSDFRCPYCGRFARETLPQLMANYGDKVRFAFRDYPILGNESVRAAIAAECADQQGKFWEFHEGLFNNQQLLGQELYLSLANENELDIDAFTACLESQATQPNAKITNDYLDGQRLGVGGTPTFFINGKLVSGAQPYEVFASVLDEELAAGKESTPEPLAS